MWYKTLNTDRLRGKQDYRNRELSIYPPEQFANLQSFMVSFCCLRCSRSPSYTPTPSAVVHCGDDSPNLDVLTLASRHAYGPRSELLIAYCSLHYAQPLTSEESLYDWSQPSTYRQLLEDESPEPPMPAWRRMLIVSSALLRDIVIRLIIKCYGQVLKKRARRSLRRLREAFQGR